MQVKYHAEFEAAKGKFTQIADDPEIQRIKANTATISNVSYHDVAGQKAEQEKKRSLVDGQEGAPNNNAAAHKTSSTMAPPQQQMPPPQTANGSQQYQDRKASTVGRDVPVTFTAKLFLFLLR